MGIGALAKDLGGATVGAILITALIFAFSEISDEVAALSLVEITGCFAVFEIILLPIFFLIRIRKEHKANRKTKT